MKRVLHALTLLGILCLPAMADRFTDELYGGYPPEPRFSWWKIVPLAVAFFVFCTHVLWTKRWFDRYTGKYRDALCLFLFGPLPFIMAIFIRLLHGEWTLSLKKIGWTFYVLAVAYLIFFIIGFFACWGERNRGETTIGRIARGVLMLVYVMYLFAQYSSIHSLWGIFGWDATSFLAVFATSIIGGVFIYLLIVTKMFHRFGDYMIMFARWQSPATYDKLKEEERVEEIG